MGFEPFSACDANSDNSSFFDGFCGVTSSVYHIAAKDVFTPPVPVGPVSLALAMMEYHNGRVYIFWLVKQEGE